MSRNPTFSVEVVREIESELSEPLFRRVPIGPCLSASIHISLYNGGGDWSLKERWKNRLRRLKHYMRPRTVRQPQPSIPSSRVLVTWLADTPRVNDLVFPVLDELGPEKSILLCSSEKMLSKTPSGYDAFSFEQMMRYDVAAWRADYQRCRTEWHRRLVALIHKHRLPNGAFDVLALGMMVASQHVAGCQESLPAIRPSAILVEHDRQSNWSCLVLAAKALGIPTYTLMHGVAGKDCVGFHPLLADAVFCWGQLDRGKFLRAGLEPRRALIGGCPRLTRDLTVSPADARRKLGLDPGKPVVMLGTDNIRLDYRHQIAEAFCKAVQGQTAFSALVRLHPSEIIPDYEEVQKKYPDVRFVTNDVCTLDEALAAADVVVVHCSGLGSDALTKRRLTVVLDVVEAPLGHGQDLIDLAGCPQATSAESLRDILLQLLADTSERRACERAREPFVTGFIAYFGKNAAKQIANAVIESEKEVRN